MTTFAPTPLQYTVTLNTGVQDMEWSGNALIDASGRLNALGFYDLDIRFTNIGNYQADGVFLHDEQVTDFDLGPIDVSGHIILDMISGFFQAVGMPSQATPTRIFSGASQKDKKLDDLLARLRAGENLTDHEWKYLTERMIEAAYRADPLGALQNGLPAEVPGFEGLSLALTATPVEGEQNGLISSAVPEPGTLGLFAVAFGSIAAMRRRCKSKR